jgi:hypothetical protein
MTGKTRFILPALLILALSLPHCSRLNYDVRPDNENIYHSLRLKVNVKYKDSGQAENFKILLKYDSARDRMLFLSPLNQVYGVLVVSGENALLVNSKRKEYWRGPFGVLLREIWGKGMDFPYAQFKKLLVAGVIPAAGAGKQSMDIRLEPPGGNREPRRIIITTPDVRVRITISDRRTRQGTIRFSAGTKGMKPASIRELLR